MKAFLQRAFSENLTIKGISLVLAVVLCFWVRTDRETTVTDYVSLRLVVPSGMMVVGGDPPERIRFTARGRESDLSRFEPSRLEPLVVELAEGDSDRPVPIPVDNIAVPSGVRVTNPVPNEIVVQLEKQTEKSVAIEPRIVGEPPEPFRLGQVTVRPMTVKISGPTSVLKDLKSVSTESIDVTGQKTTYRRPARIQLNDPLLHYDVNSTFMIEIPIMTQESTRTIDGLPVIAINTGYGVVVEPNKLQSITIKGPKTIVEQIKPQTIQVVVDMKAEDQRPPNSVYSKTPSIRNIPAGVTLVSHEPKEVLVTTTPRL